MLSPKRIPKLLTSLALSVWIFQEPKMGMVPSLKKPNQGLWPYDIA